MPLYSVFQISKDRSILIFSKNSEIWRKPGLDLVTWKTLKNLEICVSRLSYSVSWLIKNNSLFYTLDTLIRFRRIWTIWYLSGIDLAIDLVTVKEKKFFVFFLVRVLDGSNWCWYLLCCLFSVIVVPEESAYIYLSRCLHEIFTT